jgi:hypothetical protein
MVDGPYIQRTIDHDGEHRARIRAGNHEPLMAITEGIVDKRDVETALLRSLEALLTDDQVDELARAELVIAYLERHEAAPWHHRLEPAR